MSFDVERFLENLARQRSRYEEMVEATNEQNRLIASADMDALLRVLKKKNELLVEIDRIEKGSAESREAWNRERDTLEESVVRRVEEEVNRTKQVLQNLMKLEADSAALMEKQKGATGDQLKGIHRQKRALDAYGKNPPAGGSRFYDANQ